MEEKLVYYLAGVPLLGIAAQLIAYWTRLPSILLLLAFGVLLGTFVNPDQILAEIYGDPEMADSIGPQILFPIVSLSVGIILFEGGLSLRLGELRSAGSAVLRLCTIGALITWALIGFCAWLIFGLNPSIAALLGAVLVVTGPTVVAPMIRYIRPKGRIGSIVKWEGIVIDPIGAIFAVLVFEYFFVIEKSHSGFDTALTLFLSMAIGLLLGVAGAFVLVVLLKRYWIPDHLHGVAVLSAAIGVFAISNWLQHESGLVAVTIMGIVLANQKQVTIEHIVEFKENLGIFLISCLFIILGSRLNLGDIWSLGWEGLLFLFCLIFLVRPIAIFASLIRSDTTTAEKTFLSFMAPRGIVAAAVISVFALKIQVFALDQASANVSESVNQDWSRFAEAASQLIPITFLVIVGSVAIYGLGAAPMARWLKLSDVNPQGILFAGAQRWVRVLAKMLSEEGFSVAVVDTNYSRIAAARMDGIQAYCSSILSDHLDEHLDFSGIGRMLAVTNNDGVNALAAKEFAHLLGRKNSYQLPPRDARSGVRITIDSRLRGRELFGEKWNEQKIWTLFQAGYQFKKTRLTEEFGFQDFIDRYGPETLVLFVVDQNQKLLISTMDNPLTPEAGQTIIALIDPENESESAT